MESRAKNLREKAKKLFFLKLFFLSSALTETRKGKRRRTGGKASVENGHLRRARGKDERGGPVGMGQSRKACGDGPVGRVSGGGPVGKGNRNKATQEGQIEMATEEKR